MFRYFLIVIVSMLIISSISHAIDFSDRPASDNNHSIFQKPVQELTDVLDSAWRISFEYNDLYYRRKEYIEQFFSKYTDSAFPIKNRTAINRLENNCYTLAKQRSIVAGILSDKDQIKALVKKFFPPALSGDLLEVFKNKLDHLLLCLRGPLNNNNFRYGMYLPEKRALGTEHRFTCYKAAPSLQTSELSFEGPFHALRFFSPDHFKLFRGNCDTRIKSVVIRALKDNVEHRMLRTPDTLLKRGRYFDIDLGKVVDSAHVTIIYNVKKDHVGRSVFTVSPILSKFKDSHDSPYYLLVKKIKDFRLPAGFQMIDRELKDLISILYKQLSNISKPYMNPYSSQEEFIALPREKAEYFLYLLKDKSIDRKRLIRKFSNILGNNQ